MLIMDIRIMELILLTLLIACIDNVTGMCTHVENRDLLEYSCVGGSPADLNAIPATTEKLRITRMPLSRITRDTFARFGSNLWVLSCSNCGIAEIESGAFESLSNLQQLSLDSNRLTNVKASWFRGLNYLTYLDLNYNSISSIEDEVFRLLPNLVDLRISGNRLECINMEAMSHLRELKRMFLSENPNFKCPNAVSKYLEDRGVAFEKDPEWSRISDDLISVDVAPIHDSRTVQPPYYWTTTPTYRERTTPESRERPTPPERERERYPPEYPQRTTTPAYRERTTPRNNYETTGGRDYNSYPPDDPHRATSPSNNRKPESVGEEYETSTRREYPDYPPNYPSRATVPSYYERPTPDTAPRYPETPAVLPTQHPTYPYPTHPSYPSPKETTVPVTYPPVLYPTISPIDTRRPYLSQPDEEVVHPYPLPPVHRPTDPQNGDTQYGPSRYPRPPLSAERPEGSDLAHNTDPPKIQWSPKADEEFVETDDLINNRPKTPTVGMETSAMPEYTHRIRPYAPWNEVNQESQGKTYHVSYQEDLQPPAQNYEQGSLPPNNTYILQRITTTDKPLPICKSGSAKLSSTATFVVSLLALVLGSVFTEGF